jgi:SAM-dependent methyltransferase
MKSLLGRAAFKSSGILEIGSYEEVALEYYNAALHPTCADFRSASRIVLQRLFSRDAPQGRIADVGCGLSLLSEFVTENLVLIDASSKMLAQNSRNIEKRLVNVEERSFAQSEFDWVFGILADPYNSAQAWNNLSSALKVGGSCLFVVPSYRWASKFRSSVLEEQPGFAHFVKADNSSIFLPSIVYPQAEQFALIESVRMRVSNFEQIFVRELTNISSPKISKVLAADDPILDVYFTDKM